MTRPTETCPRDELARAGRSRVRRYALAAAALVLVVAAVGAAVRLSPSVSTSLPTGDPTLGGPTAVLSLHGVEITVPARLIGGGPCTADRSAAYTTTGGVSNCPMQGEVLHPEKITQVVLSSDVGPGTSELPLAGTRIQPDGRTQTVVAPKDRAARVVITTPDADLARRIAGSVRLVDSPDGCALEDRQDRPAGNSLPPLVRGALTGGTLCAYDQGWIVASHRLTEPDAVALGQVVDAAPHGDGASRPHCPVSHDYPDSYAEPHWAVTLEGATIGSHLWIYGGVCVPAAISNEDSTFSALTPELLQELGRLVPGAPSMPLDTMADDDSPVMMCRAGAPGEHVDVAYGTTVADVRRWREGPLPEAAGGRWPQLDGSTPAAWCATTTAQNVTRVFAAAVGGPPLTYATDVPPALLGPGGPTLR